MCFLAGFKSLNLRLFLLSLGYVTRSMPEKTKLFFSLRVQGLVVAFLILVNIHQSEYVSSDNFDAGVKVAVHPQTEPPLPDDIGIGVPPGRNAFISLRQKDILDNTRRNCQGKSETSSFNFLRNEYNYFTSSCLVDCLLTSIVVAT